MTTAVVDAATKQSAVGYVRMSTDRQHESPAQQRAYILTLAARIGCEVTAWYEDHGISGDDIARRTDFQRMIADARNNQFQKILCWSLDRFGRFDSIEAAEWVGPLRRAGIRLVTVAEGEIDWTETSGRLMYSIQQEGKHTVLLDRARDITRGIQRRATRPGHCHGRTPYGYDKLIFDERGILQRRLTSSESFLRPKTWSARLDPTKDKATIRNIRWMFQAFANGLSSHEICHSLNARRRPSPANGRWRQTTVRTILANPVYCGDQVWNRRHLGKYFGVRDGQVVKDAAFATAREEQRTKRVCNPEQDWVIVQNDHPAIVDRELFRRVQLRLGPIRHKSPRRHVNPVALLVFCGHCGAHMIAQSARSGGSTSRREFWRITCRSATEMGRIVCRTRSIDERLFLLFLQGVLRERVVDRQCEDNLCAQFNSLSVASENGPRNGRCSTSTDVIGQTVQHSIAETMAELARIRVALEGDERDLLRAAMLTLVNRIELWFGRHPRIRRASKISSGVIQLRPPFRDSRTGNDRIEFTREEFELATAPHKLKPHRDRGPDGRFIRTS